MGMEVKDPQGKWFVLNSPFPFHDTISDTLFQPGVAIKATETENTKNNSRLVEVEDPTGAAAGLKEPLAPKSKKAG